jgi:uncharacterized repeat protein (TIGR03806 family)
MRSKFGALLALALVGCGDHATRNEDADAGDGQVPPEVGPPPSAYVDPPETLEAWNLFLDAKTQTPGPRTLPYDVISPLFSDYTLKRRFVYLPEGKTLGYEPTDLWHLPEGSVLIKTFSYPYDLRDPSKGERLLETRLLVFTREGVVPHTYVWDEEQREATRKVAGKTIPSEWVHTDGERRRNDYQVPNTNQCFDCHGKPEVVNTLGLRTRQLDREYDYGGVVRNQIDHLHELGWLDRAPEPPAARQRLVDPWGTASLSERARAYLDSNCSHCHKQSGDASASGMWLEWEQTTEHQNPVTWGVCKKPTSAAGATCGREVDIVPGEPDASIYMCRVESTEPDVQMPPLGRNLVHDEGVR